MMATRRARGRNFVDEEVFYMLTIIRKYKNIIENKKIDNKSNEEKATAWRLIAEEFNKHFYLNPRTADQLSKKYDNIKQVAKRYCAAKCKQQQFGVGDIKTNLIYDHVLDMINKTAEDENDFLIDTKPTVVSLLINENGKSVKSPPPPSCTNIKCDQRIVDDASTIEVVNETSPTEILSQLDYSFNDNDEEVAMLNEDGIPGETLKLNNGDSFLSIKSYYYKMKAKAFELDCKLKQQELLERKEQAPLKLELLQLQIEHQRLINQKLAPT